MPLFAFFTLHIKEVIFTAFPPVGDSDETVYCHVRVCFHLAPNPCRHWIKFLLSATVRKCLIVFMEDTWLQDPSASGNYWHNSFVGVGKDEPDTTDVTFHVFIEQGKQTSLEGMNAAVCEPCDTGACHLVMTMWFSILLDMRSVCSLASPHLAGWHWIAPVSQNPEKHSATWSLQHLKMNLLNVSVNFYPLLSTFPSDLK